MANTTTTDLSKFDESDLKRLELLLTAMREQGLPEGFYNDDVHAMMNQESYNVFLTNSEYQTAMLNGNSLEIWHNCGNCGHEGFEEDCQIQGEYCNECNPSDQEETEGEI